MDDIVESTDNNHSSEAEVMGDRFLASLDFLEKVGNKRVVFFFSHKSFCDKEIIEGNIGKRVQRKEPSIEK